MRILKSVIFNLLILSLLTLGCIAQPQKSGPTPNWDRQAEVMKQWQAERQACEVEANQK